MYQRARIPEIRLDSKLINENLSFNSTNQQLIIPYRRGASSEGNRNKEEELMITVSNIPDGYTIAKEINGGMKVWVQQMLSVQPLYSLYQNQIRHQSS